MTERANKNYENYYETIKVIGSGAFGIVYKGKEKGKDELRAIKVIDLQKITENLINQYGVISRYIDDVFNENNASTIGANYSEKEIVKKGK